MSYSFDVFIPNLSLAHLVPQRDFCMLIVYTQAGVNYHQKSFHQGKLGLNMPKINHSGQTPELGSNTKYFVALN